MPITHKKSPVQNKTEPGFRIHRICCVYQTTQQTVC